MATQLSPTAYPRCFIARPNLDSRPADSFKVRLGIRAGGKRTALKISRWPCLQTLPRWLERLSTSSADRSQLLLHTVTAFSAPPAAPSLLTRSPFLLTRSPFCLSEASCSVLHLVAACAAVTTLSRKKKPTSRQRDGLKIWPISVHRLRHERHRCLVLAWYRPVGSTYVHN